MTMLQSGADVIALSSVRCVASSKQTGNRCSKTAIPGGTVCRFHGGAAPQVRQAALNRISQARDLALERLIEQLAPQDNPLFQVEVKDLLAVVDKLTSKVQLLSGEATSREETTKVDEIRLRLENSLDQLQMRVQDNSTILDVEGEEE